jgi:hypothetical protein
MFLDLVENEAPGSKKQTDPGSTPTQFGSWGRILVYPVVTPNENTD